MSYILDALKKIEYEKQRKTRQNVRVSISGDLFQELKPAANKAGIWKLLALIAVASLVTFAGTWFLLQGRGEKKAALATTAARFPIAPMVPQAVPPALPEPVQPRPVPAASPPTTAVPVTSKSTERVTDDDSSASVVRRTKKQLNTAYPPVKPSAQTAQVPADIKLSGIAWQDERAARRAVINGFLLKEGAVVSGSRIVDIRADRVRFSSSAGMFEIKLDAVIPAEVQK